MTDRYISTLSENLQRKAKEELGETDVNREQKIQELRVIV